MIRDIGNGNWWGRAISFRGWRIAVRIRRKGRRQTYRKWFMLYIFNYNYSDEARQKSRELDVDDLLEEEP